MTTHWAIYIDNDSHKSGFIEEVLKQGQTVFKFPVKKKGALFSPLAVTKFINKEEQYGRSALKNSRQPLKTMSSGEQKKALLNFIIQEQPDYIILDNPFDNLDIDSQAELKQLLIQKSQDISFIQLASRKSDILPFINRFGTLKEGEFIQLDAKSTTDTINATPVFNKQLPKPIHTHGSVTNILIEFRNVSILYKDRPILKNISWKVQKGDFWQLMGKNGSGKTTMLSMIFGDNPKAYGQDIYIFGKKKGTGESVWEIKEQIGYFSSNMTDKYTGRHSVEQMLISGFTDAVGLYTLPTETQKQRSKEWLVLLGLWEKRTTLFRFLSTGQQRLLMTARAMVKHPPLLILDEPTAGMDDNAAALLVALVNKIAQETNTSIIFVSHRIEPGLLPKSIYELEMTPNGSTGSTVPA
ncbi:ATP-binding cassette domain-containing protein [Maribacter chungangensis]|uniref:ATP-binding cassette domain-containing protein n=1 Tax=Maribacter chungangensis TaxID=1069117 RepID=A0ABW3B1U1_9FLAO